VEPARYSKELIVKGELTAVSLILGAAAAHALVCAVTMALGAFIAASPRQAAKIKGPLGKGLHHQAPSCGFPMRMTRSASRFLQP
jgi:hypothetical protein